VGLPPSLLVETFPDDCVEERFRAQIEAALVAAVPGASEVHLLQQNEASDWADIMPRSGFVLYTNALWYHVKRVYASRRGRDPISFNTLFSPFSEDPPAQPRLRLLTDYVRKGGEEDGLYLSYVNFASWGGEGTSSGTCSPSFSVWRTRQGEPDPGRPSSAGSTIAPGSRVIRPIPSGGPGWREYMGRHGRTGSTGITTAARGPSSEGSG
jgi:hypothetical protein